ATDRGGQGALEGDAVAGDRVQRRGRQQLAGLLERDYAGVGELVLQPGLQCIEHVQGRVHDFRADAVATDDRNGLSHWGIFQLVGGRDKARTAASEQRRRV